MKTEHKFDGRPVPAEFKTRLEKLRDAGILDDPKFKSAFVNAAKRIREAEKSGGAPRS